MKAYRVVTIQSVRRTYVVEAPSAEVAARISRHGEPVEVERSHEALQHVLREPASPKEEQ